MKDKEDSKIIKIPEYMFDLTRVFERAEREEKIENNVKCIEDKNVVLQLYKNALKIAQDVNNQINYNEIIYYSRENFKILKEYVNEHELNKYNIDDRVTIIKSGERATISYIDEENDKFLLDIPGQFICERFYSSEEFEIIK